MIKNNAENIEPAAVCLTSEKSAPADSTICDYLYSKNCLLVRLSGEIDHHSAAKIREEIDKKLFYYRAAKVTFDLSQIKFMDSSGLGLLLGRYAKIKQLGGSMQVLNPTKSVKKILDLAGLERYVSIKESQKEAKKDEEK